MREKNEIFSFGGWLLASSVEHMKCKTKNARKSVLEKSILPSVKRAFSLVAMFRSCQQPYLLILKKWLCNILTRFCD